MAEPWLTIYHATKRVCFMGTRVHLELTLIESHQGHLKVAMDSSITSVFFSAKRRKAWINYWEKVWKTFKALLSCVIKAFVDSSNVQTDASQTRQLTSHPWRTLIIGLVHEYMHSHTRFPTVKVNGHSTSWLWSATLRASHFASQYFFVEIPGVQQCWIPFPDHFWLSRYTGSFS